MNRNTLKQTEQDQMQQELNHHFLVEELQKIQPQHTEAQWLQIFPQAKLKWGGTIKAQLQVQKKYLLYQIQEIRQKTHQQLRSNTAPWFDDVIKERALKILNRLERELRGIEWHIKPTKSTVTPQMIQRAKEYPINKILEINERGFAKCFKHNEKTPSLFCKKNFAHCFSCEYSADTIKILMDKDGLTFKQAVIRLQ